MVKSFYRFRLKISSRKRRIRAQRKAEHKLTENMKWECLSSFEKLPLDIIYKIFNMTPESMNILRLTSSALKEHVRNFKHVRGFLPALKHISFCYGLQESSVEITIYLYSNTSSRFDFPRISGQKKKDIVTYVLPDWDINMFDRLKRSLGFELHSCYVLASDQVQQYNIIDRVFEGVTIREMEARFYDDFKIDRFINAVRNSRVKTLNLCVFGECFPDPGNFLLALSEICSAIFINQCKAHDIPDGSRYLLGQLDFDWTDTFLAMFDRKLNDLDVRNWGYPSYFNQDNCQKMKEVLQRKKNKRVRFDTTTDFASTRKWPFTERLANDYFLEHRASVFSIAHRSFCDYDDSPCECCH